VTQDTTITLDAEHSPTQEQAKSLLASVPQEELQAHMVHANNEEDAVWASGKLAHDWIERYYPDISMAAIRSAVARIYGKSRATIRDRQYVWERIGAYRDTLPFLRFKHWKAVIPAEDPHTLLYEIVAYYEAYGEGPTVDQIYALRKDNGMEDSAIPPWVHWMEGAQEKAEMIRDHDITPPELREASQRYIERLDRVRKKYRLDRLKSGKEKKPDRDTPELAEVIEEMGER